MHQDEAASRGRRDAFLEALESGLSVTGAAQAAGINRTLLYKWRAESPAFAAAWDDAMQAFVDLLRDEAFRRAVHGVQKPIFYRGVQVGVITTYNDRLLELLLERGRLTPRAGGAAQPTFPVDENELSDLAEPIAAAGRRARSDAGLSHDRAAVTEATTSPPDAADVAPEGVDATSDELRPSPGGEGQSQMTKIYLPPEGEGAPKARKGDARSDPASRFDGIFAETSPFRRGAPPSPSGGRFKNAPRDLPPPGIALAVASPSVRRRPGMPPEVDTMPPSRRSRMMTSAPAIEAAMRGGR